MARRRILSRAVVAAAGNPIPIVVKASYGNQARCEIEQQSTECQLGKDENPKIVWFGRPPATRRVDE